ncbi:hypothetical protein AALP_AA6G328500 [Arabis alpina]|uniref:TPX2 C-terminal domain-containing protein n=1 Tax=Arabis alpina TaxID=50452 RepID=A0A087GT81_ARAAL|nr:hypothetical protein AALP_AA6G328500 [Arabis alpina]
MAESAVLFHSYSFAAPTSRHESLEDNPIHALSQSVSFGRFMTENLEWGKWSSFSHKKYVDEAEKSSQPGSVAQKKAFFEAHYKKIAEAKKAKDESLSDPKEEPESVALLLNTLETLTKNEVKEEEEELVLSIEEEDEETGRKSVAVLEEEEESLVVDNALVIPVTADDLEAVLEVLDEMEKKEDHIEVGELLKKSSSIERSVFRPSMEKSETPEKAMELVCSKKISENPITRSSMKKKSEKPVSPRFSFFNFLMGNTKTTTQDQNTTRKKKPSKQYLCLCFKPEMVVEAEVSTKTQRRNL